MKPIGSKEFEKLKTSKGLVLVVFWAGTCEACLEAEKTIERLDKAYPNTVFFRLNIDEDPELAEKNNVKILPTFVYIKDGRIQGRIEGFRKNFDIERKIRELM